MGNNRRYRQDGSHIGEIVVILLVIVVLALGAYEAVAAYVDPESSAVLPFIESLGTRLQAAVNQRQALDIGAPKVAVLLLPAVPSVIRSRSRDR